MGVFFSNVDVNLHRSWRSVYYVVRLVTGDHIDADEEGRQTSSFFRSVCSL